MVRSIDEFELAWSALAGDDLTDGWRGIRIKPAGPCELIAARKFPGNEESLLVGFQNEDSFTNQKLPEVQGLKLEWSHLKIDNFKWLAITRKDSGLRELYFEIVRDVAEKMDSVSSLGERVIFKALLARISAWQEFMQKSTNVLSPEAEVGLVGELVVLGSFLEQDISPITILDGWVGPLDGLQDFHIGTGAFEVKTSLSVGSFPAKISSLEQLDDRLRTPVFLVAVRLEESKTGKTLPEFVEEISSALARQLGATNQDFTDRLLSAGFHKSCSVSYKRQFEVLQIRIFEVNTDFPRIMKSELHSSIAHVRYEIDIDQVKLPSISVENSLLKIGALQKWN